MMKRTEKSKAISRQKSKAISRQMSKANGRQDKSRASSRQSKPKDCEPRQGEVRGEAHTAEERGSQPVPEVQQEQCDLKLDEGITTIPTIDFNEPTVEYKNTHYPDSSEAAKKKVQKIVMDSFSLGAVDQ